MSRGPTQNYDQPPGESWAARPWASRILRALIWLVPVVLSWSVLFFGGRWWSASDLGIGIWAWWLLFGAVALAVLLVTDRIGRRLMPLVALMRLSLAFPHEAPSRFRVALRSRTAKELAERSPGGTDQLVALLQELTRHDRRTRGHSERVRAYSDLIGEEMHLDEDDRNRLAWGALLHDIGKLEVAPDVLNKDGLPNDEEWLEIQKHPGASENYLAPHSTWLDGWERAASEHHERWDGGGYPRGLTGEQIHIGARIVAVADAYDVMTSVRSYKPALTTEQARRELAENAGQQFDPVAVRALFNAGIADGALKWGPLAWLTTIPDRVSQIPTAVVAAVAIGVGAVSGMIGAGSPVAPLPAAEGAEAGEAGVPADESGAREDASARPGEAAGESVAEGVDDPGDSAGGSGMPGAAGSGGGAGASAGAGPGGSPRSDPLAAPDGASPTSEPTAPEPHPAAGPAPVEPTPVGPAPAAEPTAAGPTPRAQPTAAPTSTPTTDPIPPAQPTAAPTSTPTTDPTPRTQPTAAPTSSPTPDPVLELFAQLDAHPLSASVSVVIDVPTATVVAVVEPTPMPTATVVAVVEPTPMPTATVVAVVVPSLVPTATVVAVVEPTATPPDSDGEEDD